MNFRFSALRRQGPCYLWPPRKALWRPFLDHADASLDNRPYYLHTEDRLPEHHWDRFDAQGIPLRGTTAKPVYNYTTACSYALASWNLFATGQSNSPAIPLLVADWLVAQQAANGAWLYQNDSSFGTKAPWASAMAQGLALSALARVHALTGKAAFRRSGDRAVQLLVRDVGSGGVSRRLNEQQVFFEEDPGDPPSDILNGFLYALFGLYDWRIVSPEPAGTLFDEGVACLQHVLHSYDLGYWSAYDRYPGTLHAASFGYHDLHIAQLEVISHLVPQIRPQIDPIRRRWQDYRSRLTCRLRAACAKTRYMVRSF